MKTKRFLLLAVAVLLASLACSAGELTLPFLVDGKKTFEKGEGVKVYHYGKGYTGYELKGIARTGSVYWIPSQKRLLFDQVYIDQVKRNELISSSGNADVLIWFNGLNTIKCNTFVYSCGPVSIAGDSDMKTRLKLTCQYPIVAKTQASVSFIEWDNAVTETLVSSPDGTKMTVVFESVKGVLRADNHLFPNADVLMLTRCGLKVDGYGLAGINTLVFDRRDGKVKLHSHELKTLVLTYEDDYFALDSSDKKSSTYDLRAGGATKGTKTLQKEAEEAKSKSSAASSGSKSGSTTSGRTTSGRGSASSTTGNTTTTGKSSATRRPSTGNSSSGSRRTSASKRKTK